MIRQELKLSRDKSVAIQLEQKSILLELENSSGVRMKMELTLQDLEELTDFMMDCFYKAGIEDLKSQIRKEAHHG